MHLGRPRRLVRRLRRDRPLRLDRAPLDRPLDRARPLHRPLRPDRPDGGLGPRRRRDRRRALGRRPGRWPALLARRPDGAARRLGRSLRRLCLRSWCCGAALRPEHPAEGRRMGRGRGRRPERWRRRCRLRRRPLGRALLAGDRRPHPRLACGGRAAFALAPAPAPSGPCWRSGAAAGIALGCTLVATRRSPRALPGHLARLGAGRPADQARRGAGERRAQPGPALVRPRRRRCRPPAPRSSPPAAGRHRRAAHAWGRCGTGPRSARPAAAGQHRRRDDVTACGNLRLAKSRRSTSPRAMLVDRWHRSWSRW